jgi:hypothetical protein
MPPLTPCRPAPRPSKARVSGQMKGPDLAIGAKASIEGVAPGEGASHSYTVKLT